MKKSKYKFSPPLFFTQKQTNILLLAILSFTAVLYIPIFKNLLTNWDDELYILYNPFLKSLSFDNFKNIFTTYYAGNYHPLTLISLSINYKMGGSALWPYQLTNLVLHLGNTLLVYVFVKSLIKFHYSETGKYIIIPLVVALLFGIHTFQVESVAWISERKNVLYTFFFLLSLNMYLKYLYNNLYILYTLSIILFILSSFSKGMAVPLSLCVICIDYFAGRNLLSRKVILEKIPFFFLSIFFGIIAILAQHSSNSIRVENNYKWLDRIAVAGYGFMQYLIKLCFPYHLSAYYPYPVKQAAHLSFHYYTYIVSAILFLLILWKYFRSNKVVLFGMLFFIANISIVIQLLPVGDAVMADRYVYIASIGLFFILGYYLNVVWQKGIVSQYMVIIFLIIYGIVVGIKTYHRVGIWKDSLTLWNDALKNYPDNNDRGYLNRGNVWLEMGNISDALQDYNRLLQIDPKNSGGYIGLGRIKHARKDMQGALRDFNIALSLCRTYEGYMNRSVLKIDMQDYDGAIADSDSAFQLNPNRAGTIINKGFIYFQLGNYPAALGKYSQALRLDPMNSTIYTGRALVKKALQDMKGALDDLNKALSLGQSYDGYLDRAIVKMSLKDFQGAKNDLDEALKMDPFSTEVYINRGIIGLNTGNMTNALKEFNTAVEIDSSSFQAYLYQAIAKINLTDYRGAICDLDKSIKLQPNSDAFYYRGTAYIKMGKQSEGCVDLKQSSSMGNTIATMELKKNCR